MMINLDEGPYLGLALDSWPALSLRGRSIDIRTMILV